MIRIRTATLGLVHGAGQRRRTNPIHFRTGATKPGVRNLPGGGADSVVLRDIDLRVVASLAEMYGGTTLCRHRFEWQPADFV